MICPSAHNSYCQSQMFSDFSVVYLDRSTWLWPPWVKYLTSGFCHLSSYCWNVSNSLQLYTSQSFVHLGVGDSGLSMHINVLEISFNSQSAHFCLLSSFLELLVFWLNLITSLLIGWALPAIQNDFLERMCLYNCFPTDWNIYILEFFSINICTWTSLFLPYWFYFYCFITSKKKKTRYDISEFWKVTSIMAIYHKILFKGLTW